MKKFIFAFFWASLNTVYAQDFSLERQAKIQGACQKLVGDCQNSSKLQCVIDSINKQSTRPFQKREIPETPKKPLSKTQKKLQVLVTRYGITNSNEDSLKEMQGKKKGLIRQIKIMALKEGLLSEEYNSCLKILSQIPFDQWKGALTLALITRLEALDDLQKVYLSGKGNPLSSTTADKSSLGTPKS